jgi:hypothetical protein
VIKLKRILKEIGEATSSPYKWKKASKKEDIEFFTFITDQGTMYKVALDYFIHEDRYQTRGSFRTYPAVGVSFGIKDKGKYLTNTTSNKGEVYRVMSTIVDIIKDYLKHNNSIKVIAYAPVEDYGDEGYKRNALYKSFIQKQIPTAKFEDSYGSTIVKI